MVGVVSHTIMNSRNLPLGGRNALDRETLGEKPSVCPRTLTAEGVRGLIEQNAKAVNEIYLNTIAVTGKNLTFDAAQAATLWDIASQCPLLGGNPVYQARSLYTMIAVDVDFDDALICVAAGFAVKDAEALVPQITVYPNPNRDGYLNFSVAGLDDTKEHKGTITLFDAQGQEVGRQPFNSSRAQMDVSRLAQGVYQWTVHVDGTRSGQGQVTIF